MCRQICGSPAFFDRRGAAPHKFREHISQKGERRQLAQATILPVFRRMAAKLDESRLVRVQR
jgi:hypothetical protein